MEFPKYEFATHHIVAFDAWRAQGARDILTKFGIDFNSGVNGAFLPVVEGKVACNHNTLHTKVYYETVEKMLKEATSKEEAIEILDEIREMLLKGTFPH